ncbi:MAG: alginate export family protein [Halioglobus sp.]
MRFHTTIRISLATLMATATLPALGEPEVADDFAGMFNKGSAALNFRYRYEYVDQDGFDKEAKASTLRSRLTFSSAVYNGVSFLLEFDDVSTVGSDDYNSTNNGNTDFPVVADPEGTEINQVYLKYGAHGAAGTLGRQRILHGNQRFIGGVAWRQNEQTYDGLRATYDSGKGLSLDYAYIDTVNRIFGPDDGPVQPAELKGDNHFLRAAYTLNANHSISGFVYLLDIDEAQDYPPGRSVGNASDTFGLEYNGAFGPVAARLAYAEQSDGGDNPSNYDAQYYLAEAAITIASVKATLGYEVLGAGDDVGFKTPYATLHKFQGWADKFLVTPADGIEDLYLGVSGKLGPVALAAWYHDFQAEDSGADFGTELDLVATWPINKHWSVQLKYADFEADSARYDDTSKAWLTVNFKI